VRDGEKGPLVVEVARRRVQARTETGGTGPEELLFVAREARSDGRFKHDYYLSDADPGESLEELARVSRAAHRVEECFRRAKGEAGLADYQVRAWRDWHHHQTLSLLAAWFLNQETRRGKNRDPGVDDAAVAAVGRGPDRGAARGERRASAHFEQGWQALTLAPSAVCLYYISWETSSTTPHGEPIMPSIQQSDVDEIIRHFEELEDPRSTVNLQHPLLSVVVIALMAVLAGANGPTAIAKWAALKQEFLVKALSLSHGIPRKDVFRRVLMALRPAAFQACFAHWLKSLRDAAATATGVDQPVLAVDGKTARRSHDRKNGLGALHSVSVWASDFGLSLGQLACAEKSNEITAQGQRTLKC